MSVLPDLIPVAMTLIENDTTGVFNFTNPGVIRHDEIMDIYIKVLEFRNNLFLNCIVGLYYNQNIL